MICAIVLAAGRSERMGTQKLLLPLGGKPVITRVIDELSGSQADEILVVTGRDGERLRAALADKRVRFVKNPDFTSDMFDSVRCGIHALPAACEAALVVLGDQPGITRSLVDELVRSFRFDKSKIIVPECNGHRGHPVLVGAQYFHDVLRSYTSNGLRGFLNTRANEVTNVAVSQMTAMADMDTPADYQRQKELFVNRYADTVSPA